MLATIVLLHQDPQKAHSAGKAGAEGLQGFMVHPALERMHALQQCWSFIVGWLEKTLRKPHSA